MHHEPVWVPFIATTLLVRHRLNLTVRRTRSSRIGMFCLIAGVSVCSKSLFHSVGPRRIPDGHCETVKVIKDVVFGGDCERVKEPSGLLQRLVCMPCSHQKVVGFANLKFPLNGANINTIMHFIASLAPSTKIGKPYIHKRYPQEVGRSRPISVGRTPERPMPIKA